MADSLVLTGVKHIKKHTGTEFALKRPNRGGDTWSLKKWWNLGDVATQYVTCTVLSITEGANTVYLALDTSTSTNLRIDNAAGFQLSFIKPNEISRAALFTNNWELIEHYEFPSISGGNVLTVIPAGSATRPS